ncbi:MAG: T9SS type A sorting domain-containing protein, partial [Bacteroidia bacterium]
NGFGSSTPLTKTISVIAAPSVSVSGSTSICSGTSATITASGASTYTWQPGNLTGTSQTFTPSATTPYTVTGSNGVCTNAKTFTISVTATPTLALGSATICSGAVATLTASGASGYTWNPGSLTGASQTFTPSSTTAYTVTGNNGICFSNKTTTIVVNPTPTVNVISLSSSTICSGKSIAVNASGATSYTWNPGPLTGSSQTLSPASTTIYTVNGSNGTCTGTKLYTVTVNPTPTITGVTNPTVCVGQTINLTSAGGGTYSWNGPLGYTSGAQNPSIANATTGMAGQYTLVVTSSVGSCTSSANASVTVNALPTASVSSNSPVCSGNTLNLSGSGGSTYQWNGPNSFSSTSQNPSITNVDAAANGTYTLVVTAAASCSATAVVSVTIAATPTIATVSTPTMICTGQTATLSSTGSAGSYTYAPGNMTVNPAPVTPSVSTTYTASSTVGACTGTAMVSVSVSACTGIETYAVNGTISAYPNPAQNSITVVFGRNLSGKITVYNSIGQDILSKTVSEAPQATLDLSQFAKGMYLLHVSPESGKENIIRIIKD